MSFGMVLVALFFGIGFGYFVQRAGICFAQGLGELFIGRGKRITRIFLAIFIISNFGFMISGFYSHDLGLKAIGEIRGYGFYNLLAGMIFGAGIFISGGCILGTLRQIGEGNLLYLLVLVSFIPGMALVVYVLNPILSDGYDVKNVVIPQLLGTSPVYLCVILEILALIALIKLEGKRN